MRISDWSSDVCSSDLTLKRFIRVYPCSSVANGLRTRAALMVAFGGVARQAAQRGDRFAVFEAVERAFGRLGVLHSAPAAVVEVALSVDGGGALAQGVVVALLHTRPQHEQQRIGAGR